MNNARYFELIDTVVNNHLEQATGTDIRQLPAIGVVAEVGCRYFAEVGYPAPVDLGVDVEKIGNSSVVYQVGVVPGRRGPATRRPPRAPSCTSTSTTPTRPGRSPRSPRRSGPRSSPCCALDVERLVPHPAAVHGGGGTGLRSTKRPAAPARVRGPQVPSSIRSISRPASAIVGQHPVEVVRDDPERVLLVGVQIVLVPLVQHRVVAGLDVPRRDSSQRNDVADHQAPRAQGPGAARQVGRECSSTSKWVNTENRQAMFEGLRPHRKACRLASEPAAGVVAGVLDVHDPEPEVRRGGPHRAPGPADCFAETSKPTYRPRNDVWPSSPIGSRPTPQPTSSQAVAVAQPQAIEHGGQVSRHLPEVLVSVPVQPQPHRWQRHLQ